MSNLRADIAEIAMINDDFSYAYLSLSSEQIEPGPSAVGPSLFNSHYSINETEETAIVSTFLTLATWRILES